MTNPFLDLPRGTGRSPVTLIVLGVDDVARASAFYAATFGWRIQTMSPDAAMHVQPPGPGVTIRSTASGAAPGMVPFIHVPDVPGTLERIVQAGGAIDRAPWEQPMAGTMARFRDPSGTRYGLTSGLASSTAHVPMPFGPNPRPPAGTICSLEMYAASGDTTAAAFAEWFGWAGTPTMPQFVAFDAGAGIGGVWQSHTPAMPAVAYVFVDDVSAALGAVERNGGTRSGDPMAMPGMATFGYFKDASGIDMGLIGP